MMRWLLVLVFLLLQACGDSAPPPKKVQPASDTQPAQTSFNLEQVRQQYANAAFMVSDISERDRNGANAIVVTLTVPVNPADNPRPFLAISAGKDKVDGDWVVSENGSQLIFPNINPQTDYEILVRKGLPAATGKVLAEEVKKRLHTRPMPPSISFTSQGSVLPAKLGGGLPVMALNVQGVDVNFHRVKADRAVEFLDRFNAPGQRYNWEMQELSALTELVHSARFDITAPANTRTKAQLDLRGIESLRQPGLYLAVMSPAGNYEGRFQTSFFVMTDIGLHVRRFHNAIQVYAASLESANPLSDVRLQLLDDKSQVLAEVTTDGQGMGRFAGDFGQARTLMARQGEQLALVHLSRAALDLSGFQTTRRLAQDTEAFVYAPRDLYRPGETVPMNLLLRDFDGHPMPDLTLNARILQPDGQVIKEFSWHAQSPGYYQTQYEIAANAPTGNWRLEVESGKTLIQSWTFKVEEFLPERMSLTLGDGDKETRHRAPQTEPLPVPVHADYLYGAPAAGNRINGFAIASLDPHPIPGMDDFFFGDVAQGIEQPKVELADQFLDDKGQGTLAVPANWSSIASPLNLRVIASVYESGGRPVTRSIDYSLLSGSSFLGIRPNFKEQAPANALAGFDLAAVDADGKRLSLPKIELSLINEDRNYYWEYRDGEGWVWRYQDEPYVAYSQTIDLQADAKNHVDLPLEWGQYRLQLRDPDSGQVASYRFQTEGYWYDEGGSSKTLAPDQIRMSLDQNGYHPGQTAQVKLIPPHAGRGYISVENGNGMLWTQALELPESGGTVEIPIAADWNRHDLYITALLLRPADASRKVSPQRAFGLLHLPLDRNDRKLQLSLEAPEKIRPLSRLTTKIQVQGAPQGEPVQVTLAAVDVGVLNITNFATPDPFRYFFEPRRYEVDSFDLYGDVIEGIDASLLKPRFGGDADLQRGGNAPKSDVQIVSLFTGPVQLDAQGQAEIPLQLPDFNGKLRLMALAFSASAYGSGDREVTVAAPIVAEIAMPRFLAYGDHAQLSLDVQNLSGTDQDLELTLAVSQGLQAQPLQRHLKLAQLAKTTLKLDVNATGFDGQGQVTLQLRNANTADPIELERHWGLGLRPAYPAEVRSQRLRLDAGARYQPDVGIEHLIGSSVRARITLNDQPPLAIADQLDALLHYPYGCLEQTTSSGWPWVFVTPDNAAQLGVLESIESALNKQPLTQALRRQQVEKAIDRLRTMQKSSGAFSLWDKDGPEEHWLSAYVGDFLLDARDAGFEVPAGMLDPLLSRLQAYLRDRGTGFDEHYSQDPEHYRLAYRAYAGYVLSRVQQAPLAQLRTLFDHDKDRAKSGLPLFQLGLALNRQGDQKRGAEAIALAFKHPRDDRRYYGDYGSAVRDLALMLSLGTRDGVDVSHLVFDLADALRNQRWLSTQERNALFRAAYSLQIGRQGQAWQATWLAEQAQHLASDRALAKTLDASSWSAFQGIEAGDKPLYINLEIVGYPDQTPKPQAEGLSIDREYLNLDGQSVQPAQVRQGDLLLVHLLVNAKTNTRDALVVDLLPAGFELENQNLGESSVDLSLVRVDDRPLSERLAEFTPLHQEYRDDRYVAALSVNTYQTSHLFYLVRAVSPGQFVNPPPYVEDMYRPERRAIGTSLEQIQVRPR